MPTKTLNRLLRDARLQRGLSQDELAKSLGVPPSSIARWEQGTLPYPANRLLLTTFFAKTEAELGLIVSSDGEENVPSFPFNLSLPPFPSEQNLIGRERDLAALRERLFTGGRHCVAGLPGVGKTTLALALSQDPGIRKRFGQNILWCGLGHAPDVGDLLGQWGKFCGFSSQKVAKLSSERLVEELQMALSDLPLCIILDDAWTLQDLAPFLRIAGPRASVLVTTRSPKLGADLVGPRLYLLSELDASNGLSLLGQLSPRTVQREPEKAQELVEMVGGLPLALTLMGRYLESMAWSEQPRRIRLAITHLLDAHKRLHLPLSVVEAHSPTLQSVISLSEQPLSEKARQALYALALFAPKPQTFSEAAALAVADAPVEVLWNLLDLGLLEAAGERFRLHQTISDYCLEQITPEDHQAARERLVAYMVQALAEHQADAAWLLEESPTILLALDVAIARQSSALPQLTVAVIPFLLSQGRVLLAQSSLKSAIAAARRFSQTPVELPRLLLYLGDTHLKVAGGNQQTLDIFQEAIRLARHLQDDAFATEMLGNLAWHSHLYGNYSQADLLLDEGFALATSATQLWTLYRIRGSQEWAKGNYQASETAYNTGLTLFDEVDPRLQWQVALYACFLAVLAGERGHYPQAEALFSRSLQAGDEWGYKDFSAFVIARRAMMRLMYNPCDELREDLQAALLLASEANGFKIYIHKALAQLELTRGHADQAEQHALTALRLIEPFETPNRRAEARTVLAQIALARGQYEEGAREMEETLEQIRQFGAAEDYAIALNTAGELFLQLHRLDEADEAFEELFAVAPPDFLAVQGMGHYGLGRLAAARGKWLLARREGETSLRLLEALGHVRTQEVRAWLESIQLTLVPAGQQGQRAGKEESA